MASQNAGRDAGKTTDIKKAQSQTQKFRSNERSSRATRQLKQGDICWYNFPDSGQGLIKGEHPCVVISNNKFLRHSELAHIFAISTKYKDSVTHTKLSQAVGSVMGYVQCEQIYTVRQDALKDVQGRILTYDLEGSLIKFAKHLTLGLS